MGMEEHRMGPSLFTCGCGLMSSKFHGEMVKGCPDIPVMILVIHSSQAANFYVKMSVSEDGDSTFFSNISKSCFVFHL